MQRLLNKIAGDRNQKQLKKLRPIVSDINALDSERDTLSDEQIQAKTPELQVRLANGATLDDILVEAFATVKQGCKRLCGKEVTVKGHTTTRNMIPYDVQLLWGIVLHQRHIAEMRTGEGKTLVATLPAYLNALAGRGVHVVTVNDYLASRDAEWMWHLYTRLGLTVGVVTKQTGQWPERKDAYASDITYVENSELGFDYLRDNLTTSRDERTVTARPLFFAIVDEVDSILIDEARTPMIISQASSEPTEKYEYYAKLVQLLTPATGKKKVSKGFLKELLSSEKEEEVEQRGDYRIDEKTKSVTLSSEGIQKIEWLLKVNNLYKDLGYQEIHHIENALKARAVYTKDKEYIIKDGEVLLVDDNTGRVMPGRRYSEWLHQAIEAKESVQIQRESKTLATITYQHFFKLYEKICGMTGTAMTEAEEFEKIYELPVIQVPTHTQIIRVDNNDMVYFNQNAKWNAVVEYIKYYHQIGLPILIGTSSIETSELVSAILKKIALPHTVLNAKYHEQEANIIMNAGKVGGLVVATNMAWRGTDIKLEEGLLDKLATNYATRVDRIIHGKEPTVVALTVYSQKEFELLSDALIRQFGLEKGQFESGYTDRAIAWTSSRKIVFNKKKKTKEDAFAQLFRKSTETTTDELDEKDAYFGLFILGTEKHDSRRIDNQLRGRSGRQWDPGISQFFVAMDDEIMRKMGGDKIQSVARLMLGQEELEKLAFTQSQFTSSIVRAQKQMEARHFGIRKHLFDYDSVIDKQRVRIYAKRDQISKEQKDLTDTSTGEQIVELSVIDEIKEFAPEVVRSLVESFTAMSPRSVTELADELSQITGATFLEDEFFTEKTAHALEEKLIWQVSNLLADRLQSADPEVVKDLCKKIYLSIMDKHWIAHIDEMHYLREKVGLYGYAQIDPLMIYKKEAFEKFQRLLFTIKKETLAQVLRFDFVAHATATSVATWLSQEQVEAQQMMDMLKAVTKWLRVEPGATQKPLQTPKPTIIDGQKANVVETDNDVEVIEFEETPSTPVAIRRNGKLRPNDKVNVKYPDGKIVYGVKRKKIQEDVEAGKAEVL